MVLALKMRTLIFHKLNHSKNTKRKLYNTNIFKIIQSYFYLVLIKHFSKINVYCATSSDFDSIKVSVENMSLTEKNKLSDDEVDKMMNENLKQKEKNDYCEKTNFVLNADPLPSTSEEDNLSQKNGLNESKIISVIKNHNLIYKTIIPKILKDFYELKDLYSKINEIIRKIKKNRQSFSSALIKKVKEKVKEKQSQYLNFADFIGEITLNVKTAIFIFQNVHVRYQMMKFELSTDELKIVDENDIRLISEIDDKGMKLLKFLSSIQLKLDEDSNQASSILMILSKIIEMKSKDFKANKEITNAIMSLK